MVPFVAKWPYDTLAVLFALCMGMPIHGHSYYGRTITPPHYGTPSTSLSVSLSWYLPQVLRIKPALMNKYQAPDNKVC